MSAVTDGLEQLALEAARPVQISAQLVKTVGKVHLGEFGWSECGLQGDLEDPLGASYETT